MESPSPIIKKPDKPPDVPKEPYRVPTLVEILLRQLMRHKSMITTLDACPVADAEPVLRTLTFEHLQLIEANTSRDLKEEPIWDELWALQCEKLCIKRAENKSWQETWALQESKRKKHIKTSMQKEETSVTPALTARQLEIQQERDEWRRKKNSTRSVSIDAPTVRKKAKYR